LILIGLLTFQPNEFSHLFQAKWLNDAHSVQQALQIIIASLGQNKKHPGGIKGVKREKRSVPHLFSRLTPLIPLSATL